MITKQLSKDVKHSIAITLAEGVAASTDLEGATLDMAGFEGAQAVITFGAITTGAVTGIVWQQSNSSDMSNAVTLAGGVTVADGDDGKTFVVDLFQPTMRYCRIHIDRATQNAVVASANYEQYGARTLPIAAHGTNVNVTSLVAPAAA